MNIEEFNSQLNSFESTLMGYYKQKTLLIAARESLRFQYVTAQKAKWQTLTQEMYQQGYTQPNSDGVDLLSRIILTMQSYIVMTDINGAPSTGWFSRLPENVGTGGGVLNASYMSPIQNLLSKPFYDPTNLDQRPAYKIYLSNWVGQVESVVADSILPGPYLRAINAIGEATEFSIPPSIEWCKTYFGRYTDFVRTIDGAYPFALTVLSGTYPSGTLQEVIDGFKSLLQQIIYKTKLIIQLQNQIDLVENELASFVGSFAEFGASLNLAQILLDLQAEAERAALAPPPPPPPTAEVLSVIPVEITPPPTKSKLPWIAAAAVLGVLALGGKSK